MNLLPEPLTNQLQCPAIKGDPEHPVAQDDLNTAKVAVALKAAGLDADAQWLRQNLAQVAWYGLLLIYICLCTSAPFVQGEPAAQPFKAQSQFQHADLGPVLRCQQPAASLIHTMCFVSWLSGCLSKRFPAKKRSTPRSRTWSKTCQKQLWWVARYESLCCHVCRLNGCCQHELTQWQYHALH